MPGVSDILSKAEAALKVLVDALVQADAFANDYTVNTGLDDDELPTPNIVCSALETGREIPIGTGNQVVKFRVTINNNSTDSTLAVHRADAAILFDACRASDLKDTLSLAVGDFSVLTPPMEGVSYGSKPGNSLSNSIEFDMLCCCVD